MRKLAPAEFPVHDLIRERWSPRAFADKPIPPMSCAACLKPPGGTLKQQRTALGLSCCDKDDKENFAKTLGVLVEFNVNWAKNVPVLALRRCQAHVLEEQRSEPQRFLRFGEHQPFLPWKPHREGFSFIRWPVSIRRRRVRPSEFPPIGIHLRPWPSATQAIRNLCHNL